ncbi:MAG: hypothetical protein RSE94_11900 [Pseudomonas sp.]
MRQTFHIFYLASLIVFITSQVQTSKPNKQLANPAERKEKSKDYASQAIALKPLLYADLYIFRCNEVTPLFAAIQGEKLRAGIGSAAFRCHGTISLRWSAISPHNL